MSESDELDKADELDILDEQKQQELQAHIAQKRLDLSQSVEETLADTSLLEDDWLDEEDELDSPADDVAQANESEAQANVKDTTLIPPRLSLQSKPMPAVRPDTAPHPSLVDFAGNVSLGQTPPLGDAIDYIITQPPDESQMPSQADAIPHFPPQSPSGQAPPSTDEIHQVPRQQPAIKPRLAGRTTKVLLKAIARSEVVQAEEAGKPSSQETVGTHVGQAGSAPRTELQQAIGTAFFGSGGFKRGQGDVVIDNPLVTRSSVVTVMLTEDPGPVVVQYVSLKPGSGFTVHLSASAEREVGFNYVLLMEG